MDGVWVESWQVGEEISCLQVLLAPINGPAMETFNEEALLWLWGLNSVFFLDLSEVSSDWEGNLGICAWWDCSEDGEKEGVCPGQDTQM